MEERHRSAPYDEEEIEMLMPGVRPLPPAEYKSGRTASRTLYFLSFAGGILGCVLVQAIAGALRPSSSVLASAESATNVSHFPPHRPTNWAPSLFPPHVGYPGPTPTGAEAAVLATASAYPVHLGSAGLVAPAFIPGTNRSDGFNLFRSWGSLSPWYSVNSADFGLPDAGVNAPESCRITGVHFLHRHGARSASTSPLVRKLILIFRNRYPTYDLEWGQPSVLVNKLRSAEKLNATEQLRFLNNW
jgi:hypothetical protein